MAMDYTGPEIEDLPETVDASVPDPTVALPAVLTRFGKLPGWVHVLLHARTNKQVRLVGQGLIDHAGDSTLHAGGDPGGDVGGTLAAAVVQGVQTVPVADAVPNSADIMTFDGTTWSPLPLNIPDPPPPTPPAFSDLANVQNDGLSARRGDQFITVDATDIMIRVPDSVMSDSTKRARLMAGSGGAYPVRVVTATCPAGREGIGYPTVTINAADGSIDANSYYEWRILSGTLPAGLTFAPASGAHSGPAPWGRDTAATISGTPSTGAHSGGPNSDGVYPFVVQVRDTLENTATLNMSITVTVGTVPFTFVFPSLPDGQVGQDYVFDLAVGASGGTGPYTYTSTSTALMNAKGIYLDGTGAVTGTRGRLYSKTVAWGGTRVPPAVAGPFSIQISVTDSAGSPVTINGGLQTLNVLAANPAPNADIADLIGIPNRVAHTWWFADGAAHGLAGSQARAYGGTGNAPEWLRVLTTGQVQSYGDGFQPLWRSQWTIGSAFAQIATSSTRDLGLFGGATGGGAFECTAGGTGSTQRLTWTRPSLYTMTHADIVYIDSSSYGTWSYSVDGGTTWTNVSGNTNPATAAVKTLRTTAANPTDIRVRAANAAGTAQACGIIGLIAYSANPTGGKGMMIHDVAYPAKQLADLCHTSSGKPFALPWALGADLVILGPFSNDDPTGTTFRDNLRTTVNAFKARTIPGITVSGVTVSCGTAQFDARSDIGQTIKVAGGTTATITAVASDRKSCTTSVGIGAGTSVVLTPPCTPKILILGQHMQLPQKTFPASGTVTISGTAVTAPAGTFDTTLDTDIAVTVSSGTAVLAAGTRLTATSDTAATLSTAATTNGTAVLVSTARSDANMTRLRNFARRVACTNRYPGATNIPSGTTTIYGTTVTAAAGTFDTTLDVNVPVWIDLPHSGVIQTTATAAADTASVALPVASRGGFPQGGPFDITIAGVTNTVTAGWGSGAGTFTLANPATWANRAAVVCARATFQPGTTLTATSSTSATLSQSVTNGGIGMIQAGGEIPFIDLGDPDLALNWLGTGGDNKRAGLLYGQLDLTQLGHVSLAAQVFEWLYGIDWIAQEVYRVSGLPVVASTNVSTVNTRAAGLLATNGRMTSTAPGVIALGAAAGATRSSTMLNTQLSNWDCANVIFRVAPNQPANPPSVAQAGLVFAMTNAGLPQLNFTIDCQGIQQWRGDTTNTSGFYETALSLVGCGGIRSNSLRILNTRGVAGSTGGTGVDAHQETFHLQIRADNAEHDVTMTLANYDGAEVCQTASGAKFHYTAQPDILSKITVTAINTRHGTGSYCGGTVQVMPGSHFYGCGHALNFEAGNPEFSQVATTYPTKLVTIGDGAGATNGQIRCVECDSAVILDSNNEAVHATAGIQIGRVDIYGLDMVRCNEGVATTWGTVTTGPTAGAAINDPPVDGYYLNNVRAYSCPQGGLHINSTLGSARTNAMAPKCHHSGCHVTTGFAGVNPSGAAIVGSWTADLPANG